MGANVGKVFEDNIKKSITDKIEYQRLKDAANSFNPKCNSCPHKKTRFTITNPYDCAFFYRRRRFPIELKTTGTPSLSFQTEEDKKAKKSKNIKYDQIKGLTSKTDYDGIFAGFLFDFRKSGNTYFLHIDRFNDFLDDTMKGSINEKDVIQYGGIVVSKQKKRVHYRYDLEKLFDDIIEKYDYIKD